MALQINTNLTSKDGSSVASGSHVKLETFFPMEEDSYTVTMKVWRNESAYESGYSSYKPVEIPRLNYTKYLTEEELQQITPLKVHEDAQAYLEGYVGEGNVEIV